ncbi:MAG: DUF4446 family protein [Acidobacteria bacterium]|nr:DUF4446 family protein [Acidobacteriota bacterium]
MTLELAIAIIALVVAAIAYAQAASTARQLRGVPDEQHIAGFLKRVDNEIGAISDVLADIESRLISVESRLPYAITRTGVVEFDAFGDVGGRLSRAIALLNERSDGIVITLLVGRNETRFFTKQLRGGEGVELLSPEERQAVDQAVQGP